jgi:hypothetical protein
MLKRSIYLLGCMMILLSLALTACGAKQTPTPTAAPTTAEKSGYPAASNATEQSGYPAAENSPAPQEGSTYPAPEQSAGAPTAATGSYPAPAAALTVQIVKPDGSTVNLTGTDLGKLTPTQVPVGQSDQSGYKLTDVLAAAGITSFQQVIVSGAGSPVTLTQAQVTPDVILSTVDPAALGLAGTNLTADKMVKAVTKIEVK